MNKFVADAAAADAAKLREMHDWASGRELNADRPGMGRNPKARRMYRRFRVAAEEELDRRGLLWN